MTKYAIFANSLGHVRITVLTMDVDAEKRDAADAAKFIESVVTDGVEARIVADRKSLGTLSARIDNLKSSLERNKRNKERLANKYAGIQSDGPWSSIGRDGLKRVIEDETSFKDRISHAKYRADSAADQVDSVEKTIASLKAEYDRIAANNTEERLKERRAAAAIAIAEAEKKRDERHAYLDTDAAEREEAQRLLDRGNMDPEYRLVGTTRPPEDTGGYMSDALRYDRTTAAWSFAMPLARDLHRDKLRRDRLPVFDALDKLYRQAQRANDAAAMAAIEAKRVVLADVTKDPRIEAAQTIDELRALTLSVLVPEATK